MSTPSIAAARAAQRARLIKTVQTGRSRLGLDDDTYRDMLARHAAGKRSAKDLDVWELEAVLKHMRSAGFKPTKPGSARPRERRALDTSAEASKARALWLWLHELGIVRDPSEAALAAFAKRISGVDALQWTRRPDRVIEGLKAFGARQLPAMLETRIKSMQAAGALPAGTTAMRFVESVSPTLRWDSFDALRAAWIALDAKREVR